MTFRIGVISDTHGLLRPEAERALTGVNHIIHAGDIGRPEIVNALSRIVPVTAIRGNVDSGEWAREYPDTKRVRLAGRSICQSAFKFDPASASNFDPFERRVLTVALGSSELAGVAETRRARAA